MTAPRAFLIASALVLPGLDPTHAGDDRPMEALWADLEKDDIEASRALLTMSGRTKDAIAFLKEKLRPLTIDPERVRALVDWLGSDDEVVWKGAFEQLEYFDPRLAIDLETLMNNVREAPARQRLVEVLMDGRRGAVVGKTVDIRKTRNGDFNFFSGTTSWWAEHKVERLNTSPVNRKRKWTQASRAIVLLEHIGSPEAVAILKEMATGHPEAQPTKVAAEALARIAAGGK